MKTDPRGLRTLREARGLSQNDVSRLSKGRITTAYLSRLENGSIKFPSLATAWEIAAIYKMSLDDLARVICPTPVVEQEQ